MPDQKTMWTRCLGGFSVMWVTKLLISPVKKKGFFAQKRPNLARNWHFYSFWARPCWLSWCPVGGLVGGCGAGCISQDTYLLYIIRSLIHLKTNIRIVWDLMYHQKLLGEHLTGFFLIKSIWLHRNIFHGTHKVESQDACLSTLAECISWLPLYLTDVVL